jgi:prepilin-type N-terminal cleavage/methylation domain-containing protein
VQFPSIQGWRREGKIDYLSSVPMPPQQITLMRPAKRGGFTMIEMLIVLVMVGILSAMAITGWKRLMWHVQAQGAAQEFRDAIALARSDAVTKKRNSGILIDPAGMRYLRFVDSNTTNGRYDIGESVLQGWTSFPSSLIIHLPVLSAWSPDPIPLSCDPSASPLDYSTQVGNVAVVFKPDGRSWATLQVKLGVRTFPSDTFHIGVLPPTGLVQLRKAK